jgi:hypothetical protein
MGVGAVPVTRAAIEVSAAIGTVGAFVPGGLLINADG